MPPVGPQQAADLETVSGTDAPGAAALAAREETRNEEDRVRHLHSVPVVAATAEQADGEGDRQSGETEAVRSEHGPDASDAADPPHASLNAALRAASVPPPPRAERSSSVDDDQARPSAAAAPNTAGAGDTAGGATASSSSDAPGTGPREDGEDGASATGEAPPGSGQAEASASPAEQEPDRISIDDLLRADDGTHAFFKSNPPLGHHDHEQHDSWAPPASMSPGSRRAMLITAGIMAVSVVGIGAYLVYHKLVMPTPVALGGAMPVLEPIEHTASAAQADQAEQADQANQANQAVVASATGSDGAGETAAEGVAAPATEGDDTPQANDGLDGADPVPGAEGEGVAVADQAEGALVEGANTGGGSSEAELSAAQLEAYYGHMEAAADFQKNGHVTQALQAYQQALLIRPTASDPLGKIAYMHLNGRRHGQARDAAERAVAADPTNSEGWIVLGAARQMLRDRAGAREAYSKCAELGEGSYVTECRRLSR